MGKYLKKAKKETAAQEQPQVQEQEEQPAKRKMPTWKKVFIYVASVLVASMAIAMFVWTCVDDVCAFTRREELVTVTVRQGDTADNLADTLQQAGLIRYKWLFKLYCMAAHAENKVIPGTYELNKIFDYHALVNGMASAGRRAVANIMIPEGYECREIFKLLDEKGVCEEEALWEAAANHDFAYKFLEGVPLGDKNRLEGCLFPDTYEFYMGDTAENVLNKFLQNMDSKLTEELWTALDDLNAARGLGLSMYDILNVASLIEREAADETEASTIASVIYNRLASSDYPYLNIDATIQYALPERKAVLSDDDKLIESPYNTYKYPGLPAGAIANPGMTSIRGALYPEKTGYYFYALNTDGMHTFTTNYNEHLAFLEGLENAG